jgi:hypothetical protein
MVRVNSFCEVKFSDSFLIIFFILSCQIFLSFFYVKSIFIRTRRASKDFEQEIQCPIPGCTKIKCTVGPLKKDDNIVLKVRSRLFTQTLIKASLHNYKKVFEFI